jgi:hypothetical protein
VLESEILRYAQDDRPLASACTKCVVNVESWVGVESKPRDLGSDRGYRVANGDIVAERGRGGETGTSRRDASARLRGNL